MMTTFNVETIVDLLTIRSIERSDSIIYRFARIASDGDQVITEISYRDLDNMAKSIAVLMKIHGIRSGDRVLLLYQPGLDLICAFFGCICAGATPVLAYPPINRKLAQKLDSIVLDSEPVAVISTNALKNSLERLKTIKSLKDLNAGSAAKIEKSENRTQWKIENLKWIPTDGVQWELSKEWVAPDISEKSLAFLQYTSGSTGHPKGVMITHENIVHNIEQIKIVEQCSSEDVLISWLPPYHDMGLIQGIIVPLYASAEAYLMSPLDFLKNPKIWLQAISNTSRNVISVAPNFAYDYCIKKIAPDERGDLDLSRWTLAINGAEPIRADTLRNFTKAFEGAGFSAKAFFPGYGLAEATLFVSGSRPGMGPTIITVSRKELLAGKVVPADEMGEKGMELVGSGMPRDDVLIVSPEDRQLLPPETIGEIYHSGKSIAQGYWKKDAETAEIFDNFFYGYGDNQRFLKTGDLGFISASGELFVTGRIKDLIIINGVNYYPQDIESTVCGSHELIRNGECICFAEVEECEGQLIVVCETSSKTIDIDASAICENIVRQVGLEHELQIHKILLILPKKLPKTTSGKLQRKRCKELFENDLLDPVFVYAAGSENFESECSCSPYRGESTLIEDDPGIKEWIISWIREKYKDAPIYISGDEQFAEFGIDSLSIIDLVLALEKQFKIVLEPAVAMDHPTPQELARYIRNTFSINHFPSTRNGVKPSMEILHSENMDEDLKNDVVHKLMRKLQADKILGLNSHPVSDRPNYFIIKEISAGAMLGFQSCSYLNLEWHPVLQQKAIEAIVRHGTQFSCSRAFVSVGSYEDLGRMLKDIFGMDPVISSSTTLGHLSALPALIRRDDIIIMDEQAHNSMQMAAKICMANGTPLYKCKHGEMDMLEKIINDKNSSGKNRAWYLADGLYSMRGDFIDMESLFGLMAKFPSLHAYIDDAHSFGWLNKHGCGHVASFHRHSEFDRIVLAGSLSKAFAAGGGCIFTKNEEFHEKIANSGGPRIFSGPIQPSSLGAAIGTATLLLSKDFQGMQEQLMSNINSARMIFDAYEIDFVSPGKSPIFYIRIGGLNRVIDLCHFLYGEGYYVVPVGFPAVNHNDEGIRVCVTRLHTASELDGLAYAISKWSRHNNTHQETSLQNTRVVH